MLLWALEDRIETLGAEVTFVDSAADRLHERVSLLFGAVLELRQQGFAEGVSDDGYLLSFLADWLSTQPPQARETLYAHPAWALARCALSALRADALVALARAPEAVSPQPPSGDAPSLLNAALVRRSGHAPEDLALAMGLSRSPMGHVPCDNGSLVLGTAGRWWLDDPGYQQYQRTTERTFTLGPSAHNAPVINGEAQRHKRPTLLTATRLSDAPEVQFALVDLTACYRPEAGVTQVWRAVWLIGRAHLLVCDQVQGADPLPVAYHWHGHPELYWCIQQGEALLASAEQPERLLQSCCWRPRPAKAPRPFGCLSTWIISLPGGSTCDDHHRDSPS